MSKGLTNSLLALSKYHPVVIEGMGYYDPRDASVVAQNIHSQLERHWAERRRKIDKPKIVIIQGDPLSERGMDNINYETMTQYVLNLFYDFDQGFSKIQLFAG